MASKAFKDINLSFKRHPVTRDVVTISNEDAIKRSVKNIIFTILGEKPYLPLFGSTLTSSLFELTKFISLKPKLTFKKVPLKNLSQLTAHIGIGLLIIGATGTSILKKEKIQ